MTNLIVTDKVVFCYKVPRMVSLLDLYTQYRVPKTQVVRYFRRQIFFNVYFSYSFCSSFSLINFSLFFPQTLSFRLFVNILFWHILIISTWLAWCVYPDETSIINYVHILKLILSNKITYYFQSKSVSNPNPCAHTGIQSAYTGE